MHPLLAEICRANVPLRPDVLRRWQMTIRNEVQPLIDELEQRRADEATAKQRDEARVSA